VSLAGAGAFGAAAARELAAAPKGEKAPAGAAEPEPWKPVSDRKIRIGVVGGGFGASFQWHQHPNCVVAAVSDLQPARREHLQRVYRCDKTYESLEDLVKDDSIEAVAVFTDAPSHGRHAVEVMNRGKHCISAVPAAFTLEDCRKMKEAKEKTGMKYMMAETSYYQGPAIRARHICRRGCKLAFSEGQYYHDGVTRVGSWKRWRYALPPMLYPTHSTAYYVGVTRKRLTQVLCLGSRGQGEEWVNNQYNNPFWNESAWCRTSEETVFRCNVFWKCDVGGETGSWIWESRPDAQAPDRVALPPGMAGGGHGGSHGPLTNEFITALLENREPAVDLYEALAMTAPGIVAHQSALKGGELMTVPGFDKA
jgi:hypothetical protein